MQSKALYKFLQYLYNNSNHELNIKSDQKALKNPAINLKITYFGTSILEIKETRILRKSTVSLLNYVKRADVRPKNKKYRPGEKP